MIINISIDKYLKKKRKYYIINIMQFQGIAGHWTLIQFIAKFRSLIQMKIRGWAT